ncbi:phage shock protein PspA [Colwellia hornerae]|uniref:Phage shock protein PspA n=1 Tax=Colwellia hornerae TaxID=89402 RepID=A0A5C6QGE5_9GAMM|nr:phage shock protein PspA [Colwellia hornerae]TWX55246.1 phage shock protein PspA [Colwellia hornerae]TWX61246.1 phage shock protein PspA [Colwellia hornerae]TWX67707.1 phage shock protein PspA [Colwellia hornerae]
MGMFSRFTDIINANLNNMLDKAEDPEKMVKLIIQEMEETLVEVRSTAAKNIAEKKTLMRKIASLEASINNWQEKAALAISKGRDDLAKSALHEKQKSSVQVIALQDDLTQLDLFLSAVQEDGQRLQEKLQEAKRKQDAFVLRQESVEVRLKVRERAIVYNIDEAINKFERYQQKIDRVEAELESYDFTENKDLASQFRDLETDESIEQELANLKKQVVNG